jgi:hypothetical protein
MSGISKLIIKAYGDDAFSSEKGEFAASINPANLKINSSLDYSISQAMGVNSLALRYNISPPRLLSFKLLFDNTGIFPDTSTNVKDQLDSLQSIIYNFQDDIKEPYYIRVIWGTIDFKGKLVGMETSYTLFQADGSPTRAEADMVILEQVSPTGAAKSQQAQSSSSNTDNSSSGSGGSGSNSSSNTNSSSSGSSNGSSNSSAANASSNANNASSSSASNSNSNDASNASSNAASDSSSADSSADDADNQAGNDSSDANNDANSTDNSNNDNANSEAANNEPANNDQPSNEAANDQAAANQDENTPNSANSTAQEVQSGDTLPAVANKNLGDPNLAKDLAKLNALDSLRDLASGLKLHIPSLGIGALLAALLAMAKKYAKEGANYVKKKAKAGEQKAVQVKQKVTKK